MIIVRIKGGLGNQMFQYAAGRALALKTGLPLVLDKRHFTLRSGGQGHDHAYGLDRFRLADTPMDPALLPPLPKEQPLASLWARVTGRGMPLRREASVAFDPAIAGISGPGWIEGYFQTERYFADHAAAIKAELVPKGAMDAGNARWLAEIEAEPRAVSLHIRRGDYVTNAKAAARHGSCTPEYYARALDHVAGRMGAEPVVYAFSDDPAWVKENLRLPAEIRVPDHNDASKNVEDMQLMRACRHHITANSSFSWWAAWLNPRPDKIVAAPARWFADPAMTNPDIWAAGWDRIEG
jgi:hypothetical protein